MSESLEKLTEDNAKMRLALDKIAAGEHPDWCAQTGPIRDGLGWRRCWCCLAEITLKETP